MVVAGYIYPKVREELRTIGINYIETTGNVYLNQPPFYIFIDGHKKEAPKGKLKTRPFTKTGLKVVFALLLNPELINAPIGP